MPSNDDPFDGGCAADVEPECRWKAELRASLDREYRKGVLDGLLQANKHLLAVGDTKGSEAIGKMFDQLSKA